MITNIKIYFKTQAEVDQNTFSLVINNDQQQYSVVDSVIVINAELTFGLHTLVLRHKNTSKNFNLEFTSVIVNGADIRQTIYLSYTWFGDQRKNTTVMDEQCQSWYLPFGNPVSWWLTECARNIKSGHYGNNLEDNATVCYPEVTILNDRYPTVVRDFFRYNFGFHTNSNVYPFHDDTIPYVRLPNLKYNESALFDELMDSQHLFLNSKYTPSQNNYKLDDGKSEKSVPWKIIRSSLGSERDEQPFPNFNKLVNQIEADGVEIGVSFLAALYPESYVVPHLDDYYNMADFLSDQTGCCKIWIPIGWKPGNYFKFDRVGLIDYTKGAHLINSNNFMHSSVNDSDTVRFTVGFNCKFPANFTKYL